MHCFFLFCSYKWSNNIDRTAGDDQAETQDAVANSGRVVMVIRHAIDLRVAAPATFTNPLG